MSNFKDIILNIAEKALDTGIIDEAINGLATKGGTKGYEELKELVTDSSNTLDDRLVKLFYVLSKGYVEAYEADNANVEVVG